MSRPTLLARRLARDTHGATLLEFAFVAPVLCLLIVGAFDTAHLLYTRAVLQGIVQKVARDATLETGTDAQVSAALDARVKAQVSLLVPNAQPIFKRRFYRTFSLAAAAKAESFTDTNKNGTCDAGEPYVDANNNTVWDADGGDQGQGGAKDRTLYTVTLPYTHLFPLWRFIAGSSTTSLVATTILQNQPYSDQASYDAATVRNCA
jgi:Flp pilus assembly pilin Flp